MSSPVPAVVLAALLVGGAAGAGPTHHWRFENAPGFFADSIGSATLTAVDVPTQASIPATGRGSEFDAIAGNTQAADLDGDDAFTVPLTITNDFTIEVLFHMDTDPNIFGFGLAGFATGDPPNQVGWVLQTRQSSGTGPDKLRLAVGFGSSLTSFDSGIELVPDKDYYAAVTFEMDAAGSTANYLVHNLTDGTPPETASVFRSSAVLGGMNTINTFNIGNDVSSAARLDGLIDEVRLSDSVLPESELLIAPVAPVPALGAGGHSVLFLLLVATVAACCGRRLRARRRPDGWG